MYEQFSLARRVAFVTGASRGLGYAMAEALGRAGAKIVINARDPVQLAAAAERLRAVGVDAKPRAFDVTDEDACKAAIVAVEREHGRLDILVNNAGANLRGPFLDYKTADFEAMFRVHLQSSFVLSREAARGMVARGFGRIIMTTSVMAKIARPNISGYCAAKAGLESLMRQMAIELGPKGVTVNAIAPGYFLTELNAPLVKDAAFDAMVKGRTPVGRWAEPKELGGPVVFLASDAAAYVNGHTLYVDGGLTASF
ncbi:MAG: SDR family oxidoreductase [Alphaproteobacteria bacterium]|nr:SDR family oxidoreductase [Alphaproteobacteria bacterium]